MSKILSMSIGSPQELGPSFEGLWAREPDSNARGCTNSCPIVFINHMERKQKRCVEFTADEIEATDQKLYF